jgi:hypothetical protein
MEPIITAAKRHLQFNRPVDLAIDITYVAYYGERGKEVNTGPDQAPVVVQGAPPTKDYEWCYKFATASIVGDNVKFTLAVRPRIKGQPLGTVVRELFWTAREHVNISTVYADSEFYAADVISALEEAGVSYIIPARSDARVQRFLNRMEKDVEVKREYGIYGPIQGEATNTRAETTLVGVPAKKSESDHVAFVTNLNVNDEIEIDRKSTKRTINRYRRRWGIEISYRSIKDFLAWTTSKVYSVRLFHFVFAIILYNMWLLADFLLKVSFDILEYRMKPRLKAKHFRILVKEVLTGFG